MGDINTQVIEDQLKYYDQRADYLTKKWDAHIGKAKEVYEQIKGRPFPRNMKRTLAVCLDNVEEMIAKKQVMDSTYSEDISFTNFAFDIVSAIIPSLIAEEIVSVQPMDRRSGEIFFMNFFVDNPSGKGAYAQGADLIMSKTGWVGAKNFSSNFIDTESQATATGTASSFGGTVTYYPILAATTFLISDGTQVISGTVSAATATTPLTGGGTGTVQPATGTWAVVFGTAPGTGANVYASYYVDLEKVTSAIGKVKVELASEPVTAVTRKLNTEWLMDAAFDLMKAHGRDAEKELLVALTGEVKAEIDTTVINALMDGATAGAESWDKTPPASSIPWIWHKSSIIDTMIAQSSNIYTSTRRAVGNFLVVGTDVSDVIESLDQFKSAVTPNSEFVGPYYAGLLSNRWRVYVSPDIVATKWIQGYIGENYLKSGYVYAPYLPLFTTPTYTTMDFITHKGLGTSYATKLINGKMYSIGTMTES